VKVDVAKENEMPGVDDLFAHKRQPERHPVALFWDEIRQRTGGEVALEFHRKRDGIAFRPAEFRCTFFDAVGVRQDFQTAPWEL